MLTRRQFLKLCAAVAGSFVLSDAIMEAFGDALFALAAERPPVIYLETVTCTGDIFSILNATKPSFARLMLEMVDLRAEYTVMAAEGHLALETLLRTAEERKGEFILAIEGAPLRRAHGWYGRVGEAAGRPWRAIDVVREVAPKAKYVVASGTCAAYGGPYAARPNPCGAVPISRLVERTVVNVPGCPVHPDWFVGTLTHLLFYGMPSLDRFGRPLAFFRKTVHDQCPRRSAFENGYFAAKLGDDGCLWKLGCKGPVSHCDVPLRRWGDHLNWYIEQGSPCIGCTEPGFPDRMTPFFAHLPDVGTPAVHLNARTATWLATAATGAGIAGHLGVSLAKGRFQKTLMAGVYREHHPEEVAGKPAPGRSDLEAGTELGTGAGGPPVRLEDPDERRRRLEAALQRAYARRGGRRR
ncbi:MAG: hydrogenase small subunit [Chitinophagales bacterium]